LIQYPEELDTYFDWAVAQRYIAPYLIDGFKFDLRIYVLLTSVDPLRIYIFREGMARFCTETYVKPKASNLNQVFSHLTNYSLNKKNENFQQPEDSELADKGSKRSLTSVIVAIEKAGHDFRVVQKKIDDTIRFTLASIQPFLASNYHTAIPYNDGKSRCFEILGFDLLLDENLEPWLLEVNCMPSFSCDSPFDESLKCSVIRGTLKILNLNPSFKKTVVARQRAVCQRRIAGGTTLPVTPLFDPNVESEIAKTTQWRQLYPLEPESAGFAEMEEAIRIARDIPVGAAVETTASRARKEAVLAQIKEKEKEMAALSVRRRAVKPPAKTESPPSLPARSPSQKKPPPRPRVVVLAPPSPRVVPHLVRTDRILSVFSSEPAVFVSDDEDRARNRAVKDQVALGTQVAMFLAIQRLLSDLGQDFDKRKPSTERKVLTKPETRGSVVRPVVTYRQVLVGDLV
jgi:tubulin polyglutamylase TTLL6/13